MVINMFGWQEPFEGKRLYVAKDNSELCKIYDYIKPEDISRIKLSSRNYPTKDNLGIHIFENKIYSSNLVGLCRLKALDDSILCDESGNELLLKVVPRFNIAIVDLLNYISDDDEFDRYLAPQTISNLHHEKGIESLNQNEIFHFFKNEPPIKISGGIIDDTCIITVTVFLSLLKSLCRKPLMGKMITNNANLTAKIKGKIVIEKNIKSNTMRGRNDRFFCRYLQFTEDIPENQILKAALLKSKRFLGSYFKNLNLNGSLYSSLISFCSNSLRNVSDVQCKGSACNGLKFSGCYVYYKPVIATAKMILDDISIESNGSVSTSGYTIPYAISMEKLFEVYVRAYLKKHGIQSYKSNSTTGIQIEKFDKKIDILQEDNILSNPGKYISGSIKPDIILTNINTNTIAVYDVKYKDYRSYSREDRLQLLAYSMILSANNIGIILPTQTESMIFDARSVNTLESRNVKYHQICLGLSDCDDEIANYIKKNQT